MMAIFPFQGDPISPHRFYLAQVCPGTILCGHKKYFWGRCAAHLIVPTAALRTRAAKAQQGKTNLAGVTVTPGDAQHSNIPVGGDSGWPQAAHIHILPFQGF
jgi:hypothetical protein